MLLPMPLYDVAIGLAVERSVVTEDYSLAKEGKSNTSLTSLGFEYFIPLTNISHLEAFHYNISLNNSLSSPTLCEKVRKLSSLRAPCFTWWHH